MNNETRAQLQAAAELVDAIVVNFGPPVDMSEANSEMEAKVLVRMMAMLKASVDVIALAFENHDPKLATVAVYKLSGFVGDNVPSVLIHYLAVRGLYTEYLGGDLDEALGEAFEEWQQEMEKRLGGLGEFGVDA